ncbi:hypothetical protein PGB90_003562 [Kerria lacca]
MTVILKKSLTIIIDVRFTLSLSFGRSKTIYPEYASKVILLNSNIKILLLLKRKNK